MNVNIIIKKELSQNKMIVCSDEQKKAALNSGYTFSVVIPGQLSREEIIKKVQIFFNKNFSGSINFYTKDYQYTSQRIDPTRPKKIYQIYLKSQQEVNQAHPETMNRNFEECQKIISLANLANPKLNLKGLTLEEYFLAQVTIFVSQRAWFDAMTTTWILEEKINTQEKPKSCLRAYWRVNAIGINDCPMSSKRPKRGARFAVVPIFPQVAKK